MACFGRKKAKPRETAQICPYFALLPRGVQLCARNEKSDFRPISSQIRAFQRTQAKGARKGHAQIHVTCNYRVYLVVSAGFPFFMLISPHLVGK